MSDSDWESYSRDLRMEIKKNQEACNKIRRTSLTAIEKQLVDMIDLTNTNVEVCLNFATNVARSLVRVDTNLIDLKSELKAVNNSIGEMCRRLDRLEGKKK